jgi:hypothetical protein
MADNDTPAASMTLDDQLCFALHSASRAVTAAYRPVPAALDLTYPQYPEMLLHVRQDIGGENLLRQVRPGPVFAGRGPGQDRSGIEKRPGRGRA